MLFGLYEQEILSALQSKPKHYRTLIDIGAADGYYGVGAVKSGMFDKSYCYEMSEAGQQSIKENAALNGISDQVVVRGEATLETLSNFDEQTFATSVVLIDIEGFEFSLLNAESVPYLKNSIVLIEIHEWMVPDGEAKFARLVELFGPTHSVEVLRTGSRDLSVFPELEELDDTDRWLICSETRLRLMRWLHLTPRS